METDKMKNTDVQQNVSTWTGSTVTQTEPKSDTPNEQVQIDDANEFSGTTQFVMQTEPALCDTVNKPTYISQDAAKLIIRQSAAKHKTELLRDMSEGKIAVMFDKQNRVLNNLTDFSNRVLLGLLCEVSQQSPYISQYIDYCQQCKKENENIARQNAEIKEYNEKHPNAQRAMKPLMPTAYATRKNGYPFVGFDKEHNLSPDAMEFLEKKCNIQRGEPIVLVDIPAFVKKYLGIDIAGNQYSFYRNILAEIGKHDFVAIDDEGVLVTQLFTTYTATMRCNQKTFTVVKVLPIVYRNIGTQFLKLNEQTLAIQQKTKTNFDIRLYLFVLQKYAELHNRFKRKPIVVTLDIKRDVLGTFTDITEEMQRKPKQVLRKLYSSLQVLKEQGVLLDYSGEQYNTDGKLRLTINPRPFVRNIEPNPNDNERGEQIVGGC